MGYTPQDDDFDPDAVAAAILNDDAYAPASKKPASGDPRDAKIADAIRKGAETLGVDPIDYATAMSYESSGSFDPWKKGPVTKWGQHRGTIQYGEPQQKKYGVHPGQTAEDQITTSNVKYLQDAGVKPGMGFQEIYAAINGGSPKKNLNTQDANTGRTIADNIRLADRDHRPKVLKRFGPFLNSQGNVANEDFDADAVANAILTSKEYAPPAGAKPSPTFAAPVMNAPAVERPQTLESQRMAAADPQSTRIATLYTPGAVMPPADDATEVDIKLRDGQTLRANSNKIYNYLAKTGHSFEDIQRGRVDFTELIGGKANPTGQTMGATGKYAVMSIDENGNELVSSAINNLLQAPVEAALQKKQFPNRNIQTKVVTPEQVVKHRLAGQVDPFTQANQYLASQGQPQITREEFDAAQGDNGTVTASAQINAPQGRPMQAQAPQGGNETQGDTEYTTNLSGKLANQSYSEFLKDEIAEKLANETGVPFDIARSVVKTAPLELPDETALATAAKNRQGWPVIIEAGLRRQVVAANENIKKKQAEYETKLPEANDEQSPVSQDLAAKASAGLIDFSAGANAVKEENEAYKEWLDKSGYADADYRNAHRQEFEADRAAAIENFGGFAGLRKQKRYSDDYYKDKPFSQILGLGDYEKSTLASRTYNRTRLSDAEIAKASEFGKSVGGSERLSPGGNFGSQFTSTLLSGLSDVAAGAKRALDNPVISPITALASWATNSNSPTAEDFDKLAQQTRLVGETAKGDGVVYQITGTAGSALGGLPTLVAATTVGGGNPVVGFGLTSLLSNTSKPAAEQVKELTKNVILGAIFEGVGGVGRYVGTKAAEKFLDPDLLAALKNPTPENAYLNSIKDKALKVQTLAEQGATEGERATAQKTLDKMLSKHGLTVDDLTGVTETTTNAEVAAMLKKASYAKWLAENGTKVGLVSAAGYATAALEGQPEAERWKSALTWGALELVMGGMGKKPGDALTEAEINKAANTVVRVPDEAGKPHDVLLIKGKDGLEVVDVTGQAPPEAASAAVLPKPKGPKPSPKTGETLATSTQITPEDIKESLKPTNETNPKVQEPESPVVETALATDQPAQSPDAVPVEDLAPATDTAGKNGKISTAQTKEAAEPKKTQTPVVQGLKLKKRGEAAETATAPAETPVGNETDFATTPETVEAKGGVDVVEKPAATEAKPESKQPWELRAKDLQEEVGSRQKWNGSFDVFNKEGTNETFFPKVQEPFTVGNDTYSYNPSQRPKRGTSMGLTSDWVLLKNGRMLDRWSRGTAIADLRKSFRRIHRDQVESAIEQGKPVPAEVLADYPDLAKPEPKPDPKRQKFNEAKSAPSTFGGTEAAIKYAREKFGKESLTQINQDIFRAFKLTTKQVGEVMEKVYPIAERELDAKALLTMKTANPADIAKDLGLPVNRVKSFIRPMSRSERDALWEAYADRRKRREGDIAEMEPDELTDDQEDALRDAYNTLTAQRNAGVRSLFDAEDAKPEATKPAVSPRFTGMLEAGDVTEKGKSVPAEVLAEYPDLAKGEPKPDPKRQKFNKAKLAALEKIKKPTAKNLESIKELRAELGKDAVNAEPEGVVKNPFRTNSKAAKMFRNLALSAKSPYVTQSDFAANITQQYIAPHLQDLKQVMTMFGVKPDPYEIANRRALYQAMQNAEFEADASLPQTPDQLSPNMTVKQVVEWAAKNKTTANQALEQWRAMRKEPVPSIVKPNDFYIFNHKIGEYTPVPDAKQVVIPDTEIDLFRHKDGNTWTISEGRSGLAVGSGRTQAAAIKNAQERLETYGTDKAAASIARAIEKQGVSPRYNDSTNMDSRPNAGGSDTASSGSGVAVEPTGGDKSAEIGQESDTGTDKGRGARSADTGKPDGRNTDTKLDKGNVESKPAKEQAAEVAEKIEDFGEKIGGARKDMWSGRGMTKEDLARMTAREKIAMVKKDQVWSKPDYQEIKNRFVQAGFSELEAATNAYAVKMLYDAIPQPGAWESDSVWNNYVDAVGTARDRIGELLTNPEAKWYENLPSKIWGDDITVKANYGIKWNRENPNFEKASILGSKFYNAIDRYALSKAERKVRETGFPSKREAWMNKFAVVQGNDLNVGSGSKRVGGEFVQRYFVDINQKGIGWVQIGDFPTQEEAVEFRKSLENKAVLASGYNVPEWGGRYKIFDSAEQATETAREMYRKQTSKPEGEPTRPMLEGIVREGVDYRDGKPATPELFDKTFGFRGIEFGNWLTDADRQQSLDHAFDAMMDLANVLNVPPRALSLNGQLGLAFGARGKGGKGAAAAHYEPTKVVINLTKLSGAGTLAHEWAHAVDDYFASLAAGVNYRTDRHRGYQSEQALAKSQLRPEMDDAWQKVALTILEREATNEESVLLAKDEVQKQLRIWNSWMRNIFHGKESIIDAGIENAKEWVDQNIVVQQESFAKLYHAIAKEKFKVSKKDLQNIDALIGQLARAQVGLQKAIAGEITRKLPTTYRQHAENLDKVFKSKAYWSTVREMFARAFEAYVQDKTNSKSQYLVHGTRTSTSRFPDKKGTLLEANPYPHGDERDFINAAFDHFVETLEAVEDPDTNIVALKSVLAKDAVEQTETPEFKRWFKDSKVVDESGKPKLMFHGTGNLANMEQFRPELTGLGNDQYGSGFYFTDDTDEASAYTSAVTANANGASKLGGDASPGIVPVYLSIQNPIRAEGVNLRESVEVTAKQAAKIIAKAPRIMDAEDSPLGDYIDSYWDGGPQQWMIQSVAENFDGMPLTHIENDFFGRDGEATAFREAVRDVLGYDGVVHTFEGGKQHWVAWFPTQIKSAIGNNGEFDPDNPSILKSVLSTDPPEAFYSRVERTIADKMPPKATKEQITALLTKNSVKELDPEFQMVKLWLDDQKGSVSKDDVLDFVKANKVKVEEVVKGDAQWVGDDLVDADGYRLANIIENDDGTWTYLSDYSDGSDTFETKAEAKREAEATTIEDPFGNTGGTKFEQFQLPGEKENYREEFITAPSTGEWLGENEKGEGQVFDNKYDADVFAGSNGDSSPWGWHDGHSDYADIKNPIARARYNDRTTTDGDSMLFGEEIQQPGEGNFEKMPKVYQKYGELMMVKKLLYRAIQGGYDYLGLTTGKQQVERYQDSLRQNVDSIDWHRTSDDKVHVKAIKDGNTAFEHTFNIDGETDVSGHKVTLARTVGKQIAIDIKNAAVGDKNSISGDGLTIGGEALAGRYDKGIVGQINKYLKPYGVQMEMKEIPVGKSQYGAVRYDGESDLSDVQGSDYAKAGDWIITHDGEKVWLQQGEYKDEQSALGAFFHDARDADPPIQPPNDTGVEPVYAWKITPEVIDAFSDGQALLSALGDAPDQRMTVEEMKALIDEDIDDLLARKPQFSRRGNLLKMDAPAAELLRRSLEQRRIDIAERQGAEMPTEMEDMFGGSFWNPPMVKQITSILQRKAAEAEAFGYSPEEIAVFTDAAEHLKAAAKEGHGTAIPWILAKDVPHEMFHYADWVGAADKTLLNRHSDAYKAKLDKNWVRQILWKKHFSKYGEYTRLKGAALDARLRAEIPPFLLQSSEADLAAMGITPEMVDNYILDWFTGYAEKNGVDALDNFEKDELDVQNYLSQVKAAQTQGNAEPDGTVGKADEAGRPEQPEPGGKAESNGGRDRGGASEPVEESPTSTKNAVVDRERQSRGLEPIMKSARKDFGTVWDNAMAELDRNPDAAVNLIAELERHPEKSPNDEENALLLHRKIVLQNQYDQYADDIIKAMESGNETEVEVARMRMLPIQDALDRLDAVTVAAGTAAGRGLNARRMMANDDFTLAQLERRTRASVGGRPLTDEEFVELKKTADQYKEKAERLEKHLSDRDARIAELEASMPNERVMMAADNMLKRLDAKAAAARKILEKSGMFASVGESLKSVLALKSVLPLKSVVKRDAPQLDPKLKKALADVGAAYVAESGFDNNDWEAKMVAEFGENVRPHLDTLWQASNKAFDSTEPAVKREIATKSDTADSLKDKIGDKINAGSSDISSLVQRLAKQFIKDGTADRDTLVDQVHDFLSDIDPEITRRDTIDALSGYGKYRQLSKDEVDVTLRDLKGQLQQIRKLEDMSEGQAPAKTGVERRTPSDEERRLIKEVEDAKRKGGYTVTDPETQLRSAQESIKTRLENAIADVQNEIDTKTLAVKVRNRTKTTPEIDALREQLANLRKLHRDIFGLPERMPMTDEQRLQAWKTRANKRLTELNEKIAAGDFTRPVKRPPTALDEDALKLKAELERVKLDFNRGIKANELKNRTMSERAQDWWKTWRRAAILSGVSTIEKLTAAALVRTVVSPAEQVIEHGWGMAFPKIAKQMSRQYGFRAKAEAQAIAKEFTAGLGDAWKILKMQESDIETVFGKPHLMPKHWLEFFGALHGALKAPVKRAAFTRYFELGMMKVIANGGDPRDPLTQAQVGIEAYKAANRAIFMQDNIITDGWRSLINTLERADKTGHANPLGKTVATIMQTLLPIVKIPTNFVGETAKYSAGLPVGLAKAAKAYYKGAESLPPHEADLILRWLKKGSFGAVAMLLGLLFPAVFGGHYLGKRKKDEVDPGGIRIAGVDIPKIVLHFPLFEAAQIGATFRHVLDKEMKKSGDHVQSTAIALLASSLGLISEVPFVQETAEVGKLLDQKSRARYLEEMAKSFLVPQLVSQTAEFLDKPGSGWKNYVPHMVDPIKRKPTGLLQTLETGIPGLRQNVPEAAENTFDPSNVSPEALAAQIKRSHLTKNLDLFEQAKAQGVDVSGIQADLVKKLDSAFTKGTLTDAEAERANQLLGTDKYKGNGEDEDETPPMFHKYNKNAEGVIDRIVGWANAIGTDPLDAFDKLLKGETFKRMENGTIVVERMDKDLSNAERKRLGGGGTTVKLDHTVPLELGGTNAQSNLRLVTTEEWKNYTPVENYLAGALHDGKIDGATARKLITGFKNGEITKESIVSQVGEPMPATSSDPIKNELLRLKIKEPKVGDKLVLTPGTGKTQLTPEQYQRYKAETEERIQKAAENMMKFPTYQKATDEIKRRMMTSLVRRMRSMETQQTKTELKKSN